MSGKLEMLYHVHSGPFWVITTKLPVQNSSGAIIGVVGVSRKCLRKSEQPQQDASQDENPSLSKVEAFIRANAHRKPANEELASVAGMSKRKLARQFQEIYQTTPQSFASAVRLQLSCERLTRSDDQIIDIALDHGFSDQSAFTASFKRFTGSTPRQFRLRWKANLEDPSST